MSKSGNTVEDLLILLVLQATVSALAFPAFLAGKVYFAFFDIGNDSLAMLVPATISLARDLSTGWPSPWSFNFGLGDANSGFPNIHLLLGALGGAESVLPMRIWWYFFRIALAGMGFYWLLRTCGCRRETAIVMGLSFSFCGFATVDGQWDLMSFELVHYPLVLVGIVLFIRQGRVMPLPVFVALAVYGGTFIFSLGLFIAYACICHLLISNSPREDLRRWILGILPLSIIGLALAGPVVLHSVVQILDNPRVTGDQGLMSELLPDLLGFNDGDILRAQFGAFFHKDIFGIGDSYRGWFNYLEGPTFYVGMLPLVLITQLWNDQAKRKQIIFAAAFIILFLVFPALRMLTYGFSLYYFRTNSLWISMLLLFLAAQALDYVISARLDRKKLFTTASALASVVTVLWLTSPAGAIDGRHVIKMLLLLTVSTAVMWSVDFAAAGARVRQALLLGLVVGSAAWTTYPSFNNRKIVTEQGPSYRDVSAEVVRSIRNLDRDPFFRIEKTFMTFSQNDALAQDYYGVKSYGIHGKAVVNLFIQSLLIPKSGENSAINYTNWLPGFGERFALHTIAGVKYMLSKAPISWPGFQPVTTGYPMYVYLNSLALPLGVLHQKQLLSSDAMTLSPLARDVLMLQAAVVDRPVEKIGHFDPRELDIQTRDALSRLYTEPAQRLREQGMKIESFDRVLIVGSITAETPGILVFSIPDIPGWSVEVDGNDTPRFRVNHGFFGVAIESGEHRIVLRFRPPGLTPGLVLMVLGVLVLAGIWLSTICRNRAPR
ncbi:MAG: YfhO family protein [Betaproteobacteria bacterium]|nr:YfhO family protein [Betaproteobacteria bacterium]